MFPNSWKGFAAYWNPTLAAAEDDRAKNYCKWLANYDQVNSKFAATTKQIESEILR
jgi:hypothetical protein